MVKSRTARVLIWSHYQNKKVLKRKLEIKYFENLLFSHFDELVGGHPNNYTSYIYCPLEHFDLLYCLSVAPEGTSNEESCLEECSVEPEQDDDSIRVKIADLGNACWVVSATLQSLHL